MSECKFCKNITKHNENPVGDNGDDSNYIDFNDRDNTFCIVAGTGDPYCFGAVEKIKYCPYCGKMLRPNIKKEYSSGLIFEVGKCYEHSSGQKMRILSEIDTYYYGHALLGETDKATYVPVGIGEDYAVNWKECEDFAKE